MFPVDLEVSLNDYFPNPNRQIIFLVVSNTSFIRLIAGCCAVFDITYPGS